MRGKARVTSSQAAGHESWLVTRFLALGDLAEAIPIISDSVLPILTEHNFQTPSPFALLFPHRLLILRLFVGPPTFY